MRPLRFALLWVFAGAGLFVLVVYLCLRAPGAEESWFLGFDKFAHASAFFALGVWSLALVERRAYLRVITVMLAIGLGIEIAQALMALGRRAEWGDLAADALGVTIALAVSLLRVESWFEWMEERIRRVP